MPTITYVAPGWSVFTVPAKVTSVTVQLDGAGSGSRPGARVTGRLSVSEGQRLYCHVGGAGKIHVGAVAGGSAIGAGAAGGTGRGQAGGDGGGGYSAIRVGSTGGSLKAVAGGAGGNSGDAGLGGAGGGTTGASGGRGTAGLGATGAPTGGTQAQGGNGGTSGQGVAYNGFNASDVMVSVGGAGGTGPTGSNSHGGGGGGGGFRSGGGGQASVVGLAPGAGGGGGSSYTGGLTGAVSGQGTGGTGNGTVVISWVTPPPGNIPPVPPTAVKVNNVDWESGMLTKATSAVNVSAVIRDANKQNVRLLARWSSSSTFASYKQALSGWVTWAADGRTATAALTGLAPNHHYYVRLYTQDSAGMYSTTYTSVDFWTNKQPLEPTDLTINGQGSGMSLAALSSATFGWTHNDEDLADYQTAFQLQYRRAATSTTLAGAWTVITQYIGQNLPPKIPGPPSEAHNEWVFNPATFKGNTFYEWQVRTRDGQALWGLWSTLFTFRATSTTTPPILQFPHGGTTVDVNEPTTFTWRFIDPDTGDTQQKADLRYRTIGLTRDITSGAVSAASDWITLLGAITPGVPGLVSQWVTQANTFADGYTYEWQVRTYDHVAGSPSEWSDGLQFLAIDTPGALAAQVDVGDIVRPQGVLGCGTYRIFAYEQGGQRRIGEIMPVDTLKFGRLRDDISTCTLLTSGFSVDCGALYGMLRSWMHEIVVFRDGVRVWEGPITRIALHRDWVEIEAKDVMAYVYRRIMRSGYNDAYRLVKAGTDGLPDEYLGLLSVVERASRLVVDALAPHDPNVLPFLTSIHHPDDARESRVVADWSRSAWEEVDDLAATAGLDYTTVGRRIILWDTHRAIGRLPEMRDGDFSDSPIVTEYGMQLATFFAVTNGSGVVGYTEVPAGTTPYGPVELLASSYSDAAAATTEVLTPAALAAAQATMVEQAKRNISGRWPAPLVVRIPDNTTLNPTANVGFQQLIPGVWLPLRSVGTPREVMQWQKLDSVTVDVDKDGEKVHVVLSPAPNGGNDPDSDAAAEAED